jgi:hypothetical protein
MALSLKAFLGLDGSGFEMGLKRAHSQADKFTRSIEDMGKERIAEVFGLAAMEEGVRRAIEYGHHMGNVAKQMGITTDEAQKLDYQMTETGGSIEMAAAAWKKLGIAQAEAARSDPETLRAFQALGISPEQAVGMSRANLFKGIGGTIGGMGDGELPASMVEALQKVMGKGADSLIPSFKMGMPQLPADEMIPADVIEKMHGYSSEMKKSGSKLRKFFSEATAVIVETANVLSPAITEEDKEGRRKGIKFLKEFFGKEVSESDPNFIGPPRPPTQTVLESDPNFIGPPRPPVQKKEDVKKGIYDDFFKLSEMKRQSSPLGINSLQSMGALIQAGSPLQNEMAKMTAELHAVGLTLKEYNNYAKQIGPVRAGFEGGSDGALQGRGAQF